MNNFGLVERKKPNPTDWIFGAGSGVKHVVLQENRNWELCLPAVELQRKGFETYACVTFSAWNALETLVSRILNEQWNKSDRYTAKMSGTVYGQGNYLDKVGDSIRHHGSVDEVEYPFIATDQFQYYQEVPQSLVQKGFQWTDKWETQYEWVDWAGCDPDKLWNALPYTPIQVTVKAWLPPVDGVYRRATDEETNHAVLLYRGEYGQYWWIFDHYDQSIKKLAWNFYFGSAMKHTITAKRMMELVKGDTLPNVYALDKQGVRHYIYNERQFVAGRDLGLWGDWPAIVTKPQAEVNAMAEGEAIVFIPK